MKKRTKPRVHGTFIRDNFNEPIVIVIVHARHGHRENVQRFCLDNYNLSITNNNAEIKTLLLHPTLLAFGSFLAHVWLILEIFGRLFCDF